MPFCHVPRYCGIYYIPQNTVVSINSPSWLPQIALSTLSKIYDTASSTTLTQTFLNPSTNSTIVKAKYTFPLYESCAVTSFRCYVGKRLIEGVVKEKEEAKARYDAAVRQGETAGLLEQHTPDVFSTSLGNIPAGETVRVEIEYIMELKHDAEIDGLRFTIPTSIAPRYGDAPSGVHEDNIPGVVEKGGMKISVQVTMPSHIRAVNSPSHPLSIHLGGHVEDVADDAFEPKKALASLSHASTELGKDFILLIKSADISSPRALLETHPTIPNSKALMVTLVPKFTLPSGPKPEIVFIADRSGSMEDRIMALRSSLGLFLKSLPLGVKFNICSFGSTHSFLWSKSLPYTAESLEEAQRYVESMEADFGGTEILPAIKSTVSQRYKDLSLEMMVLTDGEVWNPEELYEYVEQAAVNGDVRLFSLGIGHDVSHALVEGIARLGKGFAQIVSDEREGIEGKVVRMLRGALSAHIDDYRLEWEGKPVQEEFSPSMETAIKMTKKISLFDKKADSERPISFSDLPGFTVPAVLQAPFNIPPLFPFSRTTAYAILSADVSPPSSVWLRGTTPSGDELELEIAVQAVQEGGQTLHQLAARNILQELEEGTGYIHSGKYGIDKKLNSGTFDDWVKREGVRVGIKYGLASKWTSFLAVTRAEAVNKEKTKLDVDAVAERDETEFEFITPIPNLEAQESFVTISGSTEISLCATAVESADAFDVSSMEGGYDNFGANRPGVSSPTGYTGNVLQDTAVMASDAPLPRPSPPAFSTPLSAGPLFASGSYAGSNSPVPPPPPGGSALKKGIKKLYKQMSLPYSGKQSMKLMCEQVEACSVADSAPADLKTVHKPVSLRDQTMALITLQSFEGSFSLTPALAALLGNPLTSLNTRLQGLLPAIAGLSEEQRNRLWATLLAVGMFERKFAQEKEVWELVVDKAKGWMAGLDGVQYEEVERSKKLVDDILDELIA